LLSFPFIYFSASGLFNGLQRIQIKKSDSVSGCIQGSNHAALLCHPVQTLANRARSANRSYHSIILNFEKQLRPKKSLPATAPRRANASALPPAAEAPLDGPIGAARPVALLVGCNSTLRRNSVPRILPSLRQGPQSATPAVARPTEMATQLVLADLVGIASGSSLLLRDALDSDGAEAGVFVAKVRLELALFGLECLERVDISEF
jgi:hypothetical protein